MKVYYSEIPVFQDSHITTANNTLNRAAAKHNSDLENIMPVFQTNNYKELLLISNLNSI